MDDVNAGTFFGSATAVRLEMMRRGADLMKDELLPLTSHCRDPVSLGCESVGAVRV